MEYKKFSSTATQTDDNGSCNNGCMSMYILDTIQSGISNLENALLWGAQSIKTEPKDQLEEGRSIVSAHEMNLENNGYSNDDDDHSENTSRDNKERIKQNLYNISDILRDVRQTTDNVGPIDHCSDLGTCVHDSTCDDSFHGNSDHHGDNGHIMKGSGDDRDHCSDLGTCVHDSTCDDSFHGNSNHHGDNGHIMKGSGDDEDEIGGAGNDGNTVHKQDEDFEDVSGLEEKETSLEVIKTSGNNNNSCKSAEENPAYVTKRHKKGTTVQHHKCSVCPKMFKYKSSLQRHSLLHSEKTLNYFECSFCPKRMTLKSNLIVHLRTHTGEKPFQCPHCEKCFSDQSVLIKHVKTHARKKPFECSFCKKKFSRKDNLKTHVKSHTGERLFECTVCNKKFPQRGHLLEHLNIHTGEKPYECAACKKKFVHGGSYSRHVKYRCQLSSKK